MRLRQFFMFYGESLQRNLDLCFGLLEDLCLFFISVDNQLESDYACFVRGVSPANVALEKLVGSLCLLLIER